MSGKKRHEINLSDVEIAYLSDGDSQLFSPSDRYQLDSLKAGLSTFFSDVKPRDLWNQYRNVFLPEYIRKHPGKRPYAWWQWDAPRQPDGGSGAYWEGILPEPRKHAGGGPFEFQKGFVPRYEYGVPVHVTYSEYDPPFFESQAAYLMRHGLLSETERRALKESDYARESIEDVLD